MSVYTKAGLQFVIGSVLLVGTFAREDHGFTSVPGPEATGFNLVAIIGYAIGLLLIILAVRNIRKVNSQAN